MSYVVTGVGAVTALGADARVTWSRILAGERGLRPLSLFELGEVRTNLVAEVAAIASSSSRTSELALMAAREAIADAALDIAGRKVGLVVGGTTAGMLETESILAALAASELSRDGAAREAALAKMLAHPLSAPTERLARELGPFARTRSLSSACSSGANAIAVGAAWLELGLVDVVVCGGADALCRTTFSGFHALVAMDPDGAKPFDRNRRGLTIGEGAGFLVLEREGDASAKRARCTLLGWASASEAHHITNPAPAGDTPLEAIHAALGRAGLEADAIDYVNAHGTGTPLNDAMEARVLERLFGPRVAEVPVSSQKGMIGHTLAAAGAIEAVLTALAIESGVLPPTGGLVEPDPAIPLRHVREAERSAIRAAISSSFGFGGMDTALVLGRVGAEEHRAPPLGARTRVARSVVVTGVAAVTPAGVFEGEAVAGLAGTTLPADAPSVTIPEGVIDGERGRRLDRCSRLATLVCERALGPAAKDAGIVLGIAFGPVDTTAEYVRRLRDKGPRMVRPADFPSLVPSSPAGHVSIYLGLHGPALVVADLAASGECAVVQAAELIASGIADRVCAAGVEERSKIVEEVLSIVFGHSGGARREGAAAISLAAAGPGVLAMARLGEIAVVPDGAGLALSLPPPPARAIVVSAGASERARSAETAIVDRSGWRDIPRVLAAPSCGAHEAAGAMAIAIAAAKVARREVDAALFVGSSRGYGYAGTVWPPDPNP